jgi:hypothetical protein
VSLQNKRTLFSKEKYLIVHNKLGVAIPQVIAKRFDGIVDKRNLSILFALPLPDCENPVFKVHLINT